MVGCGGDQGTVDGETPGEEPPAQAETGKAADDFAPPPWADRIEDMVAVAELDADGRERLAAAFADAEANWRGWIDGPDGQALIAHEAAMRAAAARKDLRGVRAATAAAKPLRADYRSLIDAQTERLLAALGPTGRARWQAHRLSSRFLEVAAPLELHPDQVAAVREQARAVHDADPDAEIPALYVALEQQVVAEVLTPDQRRRWPEVARKSPLLSLSVPMFPDA